MSISGANIIWIDITVNLREISLVDLLQYACPRLRGKIHPANRESFVMECYEYIVFDPPKRATL
jgi:hypothetical protein